MCRGASFHYFKINVPLICYFLILEEYLNLHAKINEMVNENSVDYYPSPADLTSRIHPIIFLKIPWGFIHLQRICWILFEYKYQYIPSGSCHHLPGRGKLLTHYPQAAFFWKSVSPTAERRGEETIIFYICFCVIFDLESKFFSGRENGRKTQSLPNFELLLILFKFPNKHLYAFIYKENSFISNASLKLIKT